MFSRFRNGTWILCQHVLAPHSKPHQNVSPGDTLHQSPTFIFHIRLFPLILDLLISFSLTDDKFYNELVNSRIVGSCLLDKCDRSVVIPADFFLVECDELCISFAYAACLVCALKRYILVWYLCIPVRWHVHQNICSIRYKQCTSAQSMFGNIYSNNRNKQLTFPYVWNTNIKKHQTSRLSAQCLWNCRTCSIVQSMVVFVTDTLFWVTLDYGRHRFIAKKTIEEISVG